MKSKILRLDFIQDAVANLFADFDETASKKATSARPLSDTVALSNFSKERFLEVSEELDTDSSKSVDKAIEGLDKQMRILDIGGRIKKVMEMRHLADDIAQGRKLVSSLYIYIYFYFQKTLI